MSSDRPILNDPDIADYLSYLIECAAIQHKNCPAMEDILQKTMLAVLLELRKKGSIAYPKAFLSKVLKHKYNDWLRKKYRSAEHYETLNGRSEGFLRYEETFDAEEEEAEKDREAELLRREIGRLMEVYRQVIVRYYLHGQSVDTIAGALLIPRGTVTSRLHKGRELLREGMKKNMEKYTEASYAPKNMAFQIAGSCGINREPFCLVSTLIDANILITTYEKPLSAADIAGAMGIPCAYLEGFLKKLTEGELLGQTSGGLYYTRCYIQKMEDHYGDVEAQEAAAKELAEPLWKEIWNTLSGMMEEEEVRAMTDKQRATLLLYFLNRILENCIRRTEETLGVSVHYPGDYPERPNGGRWYATGIILEEDARQPKYYGSGPVQQGRRNEGYYIWDYQSLFGDAHWAYPGMKYSPDFGAVGRFLVSLVPDGGVTAEDERLYELIPEFEKLHILRRDADGKAVLDIPALSWEAANRWSVPLKELTERVYRIAGERLEELYRSRKNKVPHHVDKWQMYEHEGALGSYVMAQMLAIVKAGLLPYPIEIGKTPVIFLAYTKNGQKG